MSKQQMQHIRFIIKNFDTREVNNGEKVGYAKKTLEPNETLTKTIKKETLTSSASKNGRHSRSDVSTNRIPPTQQNVNDNTKYSIEESENDSGSFNLPLKETAQDNSDIRYSKGSQS